MNTAAKTTKTNQAPNYSFFYGTAIESLVSTLLDSS